MKRSYTLLLAALSGLLLFAAWPVSPLTALIFVAWIPLLIVADSGIRRNHFFACAFITMLVWNTGATWWIWNSTDIGTIAAIITNSLLMCLPWWGYHIFRKTYNRNIASAALVVCWMLFEYIHLNWQLSWPWLNLGNVFAARIQWVQWYEYTGAAGGTLWVLLGNICLYRLLVNPASSGSRIKNMIVSCAVLFIPILVSYLAVPQITENRTAGNVVIVQPNIDPYGRIGSNGTGQQVSLLLQLTNQAIDSNTRLVVWPETALTAADLVENTRTNPYYAPVFSFMEMHPAATLLTGIETYKSYGTTKSTPTARKANDGNYYDAWNAAVSIHASAPLSFYAKSKLVPGVESLPTFLNFLAPVFEKFGGTAGGYGRSDSAAVFRTPGNPYITAPIICYESIYGEYVAGYVQKGANILTIITNDGWWGNTPGHKQHLSYAALRAVETRRWVARSANTGISAVIDPAGNIRETRPWDQAAVLKYNIPVTSARTFYVQWGDYLYKTASLLALFLIVIQLIRAIKKRFVKA
ncbi:apolipoprotein N-acyltransferase [Sediminibacterium ginsengisoli]|uniref:apolipoprotein N-acyltransferase n=1 Tax=Sediminibacterium ginsengisoli TaxID=413434 RepID=UPI001115BCFC|nr:apolipoprotein N-acyltransferase [Sediminibacterium ginsengisoli]